jgi:hypothetical protein
LLIFIFLLRLLGLLFFFASHRTAFPLQTYACLRTASPSRPFLRLPLPLLVLAHRVISLAFPLAANPFHCTAPSPYLRIASALLIFAWHFLFNVSLCSAHCFSFVRIAFASHCVSGPLPPIMALAAHWKAIPCLRSAVHSSPSIAFPLHLTQRNPEQYFAHAQKIYAMPPPFGPLFSFHIHRVSLLYIAVQTHRFVLASYTLPPRFLFPLRPASSARSLLIASTLTSPLLNTCLHWIASQFLRTVQLSSRLLIDASPINSSAQHANKCIAFNAVAFPSVRVYPLPPRRSAYLFLSWLCFAVAPQF